MKLAGLKALVAAQLAIVWLPCVQANWDQNKNTQNHHRSGAIASNAFQLTLIL
jgi:hypothetical protein